MLQYFFFYIILFVFVSLKTNYPDSYQAKNITISDTLNSEARINELKKIHGQNLIIKRHQYFIIASALSVKATDDIINNTISNARECFYNDYFQKLPDECTVIYLFNDDKTYRYWSKELFGYTDVSRYGYYIPSKKTMVMNISTGTGTLVHEITHALVRYDFPEIPSWFNEGLGSLYERCSLDNGIIKGYVNWRLPILHKAITNKKFISLNKLMCSSSEEFYGDHSDIHYAEARYLCMYLQERELLKSYYKYFRDNYFMDGTGISQLETILNKKLADIEIDYVAWVKDLSEE